MNPSLPRQMKAVEIARPGGPEVLRPVERPLPGLQPGEVLIRVAAAGVNGPDLMQRKGLKESDVREALRRSDEYRQQRHD